MEKQFIDGMFVAEDKSNLPLEELCPFISECKQEIDERRCSDYYNSCIVYQRLKILSKDKVPTGLQRFQMRYKDFDYGRMLGI